MEIAVSLGLIWNIIKSGFESFKKGEEISLLFIGLFSITALAVIGLDSGRMLFFYTFVILSLFVTLFLNKPTKIYRTNLLGLALIIGFFVHFLFSYFYSPAATFDYGVWKIRQVVTLAILPSIIVLLKGRVKNKHLKTIENFIVFAGLLTSLLMLFNFLTQGGMGLLQSEWFSRQTVGSMNPVWASRFLGVGLLILQSPNFSKKPFVVYPLSVLFILAALLTGSKTILYFSLPIVILYRIIRSGLTKKQLFNIFIIILLISAAVVFLSNVNSLAFVRRFSLQSDTIGQREIMQQSTINSFKSNDAFRQIFGNGGGTIGASMGYGFVREYPHNMILEVLYEMGILGVINIMMQFLMATILFLKGKRNWIFFAYLLHFLFSMTSGDLATNDLVFTMFALYLISEKEGDDTELTKEKKGGAAN